MQTALDRLAAARRELAALRDNPAALRMRLAYLEAERSREVLAVPPEDGKTDSTVAQEKSE